MKPENRLPGVGVVAIGRNEGERLRLCLESARKQSAHVVYVDSGSTDGSVQLARGLGVEGVALDLSVPFTAARARNEGLRRLRAWRPELEYVHFIDGDCEFFSGWIASALAPLLERTDLAVVCGRVRERYRQATIYNRLADLEWNTPPGEVEACGGIALMRVSAFEQVGGFDAGIMAGEELELCQRLRARGHKVLRLDADMVLHDAAMTHMLQWWRRTVRTGYGIAESVSRPGPVQPAVMRHLRSAITWGLAFPALVLVGLVWSAQRASILDALLVVGSAAAVLLAQTVRIALKRNSPGENMADALLYGAGCMAAKAPQLVGVLRYLRQRVLRQRARLIEYK
jgi:GT2 family glycosyltransferase